MSREVELFALNVCFVDGKCDEHVHLAFEESLSGFLECDEGGSACIFSGLSKLHVDFFVRTVDEVDSVADSIGCGRNDMEGKVVAQPFFVIVRHLQMPEDDRRAKVKHSCFGEDFADEFITHAVGVTLCDSHFDFLGGRLNRCFLVGKWIDVYKS